MTTEMTLGKAVEVEIIDNLGKSKQRLLMGGRENLEKLNGCRVVGDAVGEVPRNAIRPRLKSFSVQGLREIRPCW